MKKVDFGNEVVVYTVHNLLELDRLWNDLLMNWAKNETEDKRNCWKGKHAWWLVPRLQEEDSLHDFMISKGIKTYNLWLENTLLDKAAGKYYQKREQFTKINSKIKLGKDIHMAAFGDNLIKFEIPEVISKKLEKLYKETKKLEDLDVKYAIDIFKENAEISFTVIKDEFLANKFKEEIVSLVKSVKNKDLWKDL